MAFSSRPAEFRDRDRDLPTLESLLEDRRLNMSRDSIHDALKVQRSSLPLFSDEWHGDNENRAWQMAAIQQTPLIHGIHQIANNQNSSPQLYLCPIPYLPLSQTLLLAPSLSLNLRSLLPILGDDLSSVPRAVYDNFRFLARYDGSIIPSSDSTFSAWFGNSSHSIHSGFLFRVNPISFGWPNNSLPFYLSGQQTSRAFNDALIRTQINVGLHCRPFPNSDRGFLSVEAKRETSLEDDRWKGKISYTHSLSMTNKPKESFIKAQQDWLSPTIIEAAESVNNSSQFQTIRDYFNDFKFRLLQNIQLWKERYFPDLYDSPPLTSTTQRTTNNPSITSTISAINSSRRTETISSPWLNWKFPSYLTLAISSPLTFLPYQHSPPPSYHINDSPFSHRTRELSASIGLSLLPVTNTLINIEHFMNYDAQSTFLTINSRSPTRSMDSSHFYANTGIVKHRGTNHQIHFGLGLALGGI